MVEKVEYSVQLFYFFWYFEVGVNMNDFKTKAINGIGDNLLKILSVNLTYDSYNVIKDITKENNEKKKIIHSLWLDLMKIAMFILMI